MPSRVDRRAFLRRALMAAGWGLAVSPSAACTPSASPGPTAAVKPTEAPKPAGPAPTTVPAATTAAPAAPATVTKVSYGIVSYNPFHIVVIVGIEKPELMRKHGIEIDLLLTGNAPAAVQAIVGGSMNMTTATADSGWAAQDRSPGLMQIAAVATGYPFSLIARPEIKSVAELRGKPLGSSAVRGGADTTALRSILLQNGLTDGDFTVVPAGSIAERAAAMKAGTIVGTAQLEPQTSLLLDQGFEELDNADNYPDIKRLQSVTVVAKKDWYEPNMAIAVAFFKGWLDITRWVYDPNNKDEVIAIMAKTMKVEPGYAANTYERHVVKSKTIALDLRVDPELMAPMADLQKKIGLENVPNEFEKYIDSSIAEKAMAS